MSDEQISSGFGNPSSFTYRGPELEGKIYKPIEKMLAIGIEHYQSVSKILYKISRKKRHFLKSKPKFAIDVEEFISLLEKLQKDDVSHDIPYIQLLTNNWFKLLDHQHRLLSKGIQGNTLDKINTLIALVDQYPEGEEKSVHYYLSHFAGKDWFPFPFMETLQKLHESPITLAEWIECAKTGEKAL